MKIIKLLTLSILFACSSQNAFSESSNFAAGFGHLYGGLTGIQSSINPGKNKYRANIGLFGVGLGYERKITDHQALGMSTGAYIPQGRLVSLDWSYYFSGTFQRGWAVSGSLIRAKIVSLSIPSYGGGGDSDSDQIENYAFFSFGYHY